MPNSIRTRQTGLGPTSTPSKKIFMRPKGVGTDYTQPQRIYTRPTGRGTDSFLNHDKSLPVVG
jgi:hypothetical protein